MELSGQEAFKTCYRGRKGPLYHAAYMRMGKVLLTQRILRSAGVNPAQKYIFDYCPAESCTL